MKASEEIRSILDRCKSGELAHKQSMFFCGTSRCVAGWKVHFDFLEKNGLVGSNRDLYEFAYVATQRGYDVTCYDPPGEYAARAWDLEEDQAERLFETTAIFEQQYAVVAELEAEGK